MQLADVLSEVIAFGDAATRFGKGAVAGCAAGTADFCDGAREVLLAEGAYAGCAAAGGGGVFAEAAACGSVSMPKIDEPRRLRERRDIQCKHTLSSLLFKRSAGLLMALVAVVVTFLLAARFFVFCGFAAGFDTRQSPARRRYWEILAAEPGIG